jgi:hypothetical protein
MRRNKMARRPRKFKPLTKEELTAKIEKATKGGEAEKFYEGNIRGRMYDLLTDHRQVKADLGKVNFDTENFACKEGEGYSGAQTGFLTFPNGLVAVGCSAGGDWEYPLFFIIYHDGKTLRAYIPTEGNTWNTDTKRAYGNDSEANDGDTSDLDNLKKRYPQLAERYEDEDPEEFDPGIVPNMDMKLITQDILQRLEANEPVDVGIIQQVNVPMPEEWLKDKRPKSKPIQMEIIKGDEALATARNFGIDGIPNDKSTRIEYGTPDPRTSNGVPQPISFFQVPINMEPDIVDNQLTFLEKDIKDALKNFKAIKGAKIRVVCAIEF